MMRTRYYRTCRCVRARFCTPHLLFSQCVHSTRVIVGTVYIRESRKCVSVLLKGTSTMVCLYIVLIASRNKNSIPGITRAEVSCSMTKPVFTQQRSQLSFYFLLFFLTLATLQRMSESQGSRVWWRAFPRSERNGTEVFGSGIRNNLHSEDEVENAEN